MGGPRHDMPEREGEAGFTLLELLISMSLLAVMMTMTYSVFYTAMSAVPRGEAAAEISARLRIATSLITRQVRSLVDYPAETDEEVHPYFVGDQQGFSFITAAPQLGGGEGLGWVTYSSDGSALAMAERLIFSTGGLSEDEESEDFADPEEAMGDASAPEAAETVLLAGLEAVAFEYLRLDGTEGEWLEEWDGLEEQTLPAAIRLTVEGLGLGGSAWVQEIPVISVVYALGAYDSEAGLYWDDDDELDFIDEED